MILLIDNYDSFTYNLVQRIGELDPLIDLEVVRNDRISVNQAQAMAPTHLLLSPGPWLEPRSPTTWFSGSASSIR